MGNVCQKILIFSCLLFGGASCCTKNICGEISEPTLQQASGAFRAGAAKVDLTPMPGFPMGGFSLAGQTGRGYWARLYARAIYLEDANGHNFVLVSCDLWSIPGGLADRVAQIVLAQKHGRHIGRAQIVLAATHTHHSPGNFATSPFYNQFAACKSGFDPDLFEFLAHKIAEAIVTASQNACAANLYYNKTDLTTVVRNRSFEAFSLNPESREVFENNKGLPAPEATSDGFRTDAYRATAPTLTVLRMNALDSGQPIAVAAFFAVHPTAKNTRHRRDRCQPQFRHHRPRRLWNEVQVVRNLDDARKGREINAATVLRDRVTGREWVVETVIRCKITKFC